ncbi:FhaA domain-containing protein [Leptolyngbya sp. 7M]|uniref:FhaA domain-containing protein n=1 Tax=Leptolyngbya sp. 7M TaxID=2812896 RepID=UPI001B8C29EF|nr:FhaA domain-containing protein [Leptolyngbya sp. 7M]QYO65601.1 DUF3662 domain-containing protein [Leptolyngbya sp. 7M]
MSVLEKVRRWIDGESAELVLEQAARDAQVKPRSEAEEFIVKIARAVESVMQKELLPLPQGTAIIPTEYTIFLASEDDKEWQGVKRRGLEQGLYHILAERAKEIAGKKKLETRSFVIELRVDGTLSKGDVRVQHSWEDSSSGKTGVLARPKAKGGSSGSPTNNPGWETSARPTPYVPPSSAANHVPQRSSPPSLKTPEFTQHPLSREPSRTSGTGGIQQAIPLPPEDGETMTSVRPRARELFKLEIWLNGVRQNIVPIFSAETVIGRGSRSRPVDITLSGDPEISRRHLVILADGKGNHWVVNEGRNPAMIQNYELPADQRVPLKPGVSVAIGRYVLRIQPPV